MRSPFCEHRAPGLWASAPFPTPPPPVQVQKETDAGTVSNLVLWSEGNDTYSSCQLGWARRDSRHRVLFLQSLGDAGHQPEHGPHPIPYHLRLPSRQMAPCTLINWKEAGSTQPWPTSCCIAEGRWRALCAEGPGENLQPWGQNRC